MNVIWGEENWKVRGKWLLIAALVLIVLNLFLSLLIHRQNSSFEVEGNRFQFSSREGNQIHFRDRDRENLTITIENPEENLVSFATHYYVRYQGYELEVASDDYFDHGFRVRRNEGTDYIESITESGWSSGGGMRPSRNHGEIHNLPFDVQLVYGLEDTVPYVAEGFIGNMGMIFFAFTLISIGGAFVILLPDVAWKLEHFLWVENGEPSEFYLGLHIILGIFTMILVFGAYFFMIF